MSCPDALPQPATTKRTRAKRPLEASPFGAVLFAREGAKVFAVDKNADSMTETVARVGNDGEIASHVCDVVEDAQVATMIEACRKRFGRIDILVNNVGG